MDIIKYHNDVQESINALNCFLVEIYNEEIESEGRETEIINEIEILKKKLSNIKKLRKFEDIQFSLSCFLFDAGFF